jgi:hypothetical protein
MTPSKIRYILSGLKSEIRRETDYERRCHLADMGCFWSIRLMTFIADQIIEPERNSMICQSCGLLLKPKDFSSFVKKGILFFRTECKWCVAEKAIETRKYKRHKKKRESILK